MTARALPTRLTEALAALREPGTVAVAGCTDLMVALHAEQRTPAAVVDVSRLPELRGIGDAAGYLDIGAATTFSELRQSALVTRHAPIIAEVAATVGAWQIQNRATVGGNIANASPAGDSLPVWLALGAELVLASTTGERVVPYDAMHLGYRQTALTKGELVVRVRVPKVAGRVGYFVKVGTRAAQAISKVVVAFCAERDGGGLRKVRLAAGSVAATPVRLSKVEAACEGAGAGAELAERAAALARAEVTPIDDVRSTAEYRAFVLGQVIRRILLRAGNA